ncbi:hypothetical protein BSKO_13621 [Bryopsis sp. KO-2023]|nr:hypothetical protein BSKO_13621 [Bryopsis sp. KO-2023]
MASQGCSKDDANRQGKKRQKRKAAGEAVGGSGVTPSVAAPSGDDPKDVVPSEQKRQKREVLSQGSGDGNANEAMEIRHVMGITPQPEADVALKPSSGGFSFGFTPDANIGVEIDPVSDSDGNVGNLEVNGEAPEQKEEKDLGNGRKVYVGGMPYGLSEEEVKEFWTECGEVESVDCMVFPDTKKFRGIAFVTFSTADGYQQALLSDGEMVDGFQLKVKPWTGKEKRTPVEKPSEQQNGQMGQLEVLGQKSEGYNVAFVCNVPYDVTKEDLHDVFSDVGVDYVRLHTKPDSDESRGFAHVHFRDGDSLDKAIALDGMMLKDRVIRIGYAKPRMQVAGEMPSEESKKEAGLEIDLSGASTAGGDVGCKHPLVHAIHMFNLPFAATREDFDRLFEGCGIKKVLLPLDSTKKANAGVAVVEFTDAQSCENAIKVNGAKFGGREIKLRFAKSRDVSKFRFLISKARGGDERKKGKKGKKKPAEAPQLANTQEEDDDPLMALL